MDESTLSVLLRLNQVEGFQIDRWAPSCFVSDYYVVFQKFDFLHSFVDFCTYVSRLWKFVINNVALCFVDCLADDPPTDVLHFSKPFWPHFIDNWKILHQNIRVNNLKTSKLLTPLAYFAADFINLLKASSLLSFITLSRKVLMQTCFFDNSRKCNICLSQDKLRRTMNNSTVQGQTLLFVNGYCITKWEWELRTATLNRTIDVVFIPGFLRNSYMSNNWKVDNQMFLVVHIYANVLSPITVLQYVVNIVDEHHSAPRLKPALKCEDFADSFLQISTITNVFAFKRS